MPDLVQELNSGTEAEQVLEEVSSGSWQHLAPFNSSVVAALDNVARVLRHAPQFKTNGAIQALAFWLRASRMKELQTDWERSANQNVVRVPRGLVFHIPPTNVDTMAIYSWAISAVMGNRNIVRVSRSSLDALTPLLELVEQTLELHHEVQSLTRFVVYGHESEITEVLSRADARVIWGGDASVHAIRSIQSSARCLDISFVDRYSLSAIDAKTMNTLGPGEADEFMRKLMNDALWFDQLGCASPRSIVLVGDAEESKRAIDRLGTLMPQAISNFGYEVSPTTAMMKLTDVAYRSAIGQAASIEVQIPALSLIKIQGTELLRDTPGGGFFTIHSVDTLADLAPMLKRTDQTLGHFGFSRQTLLDFVAEAGTRSPDRIVPVGSALDFDTIWDGSDLLSLLTRAVRVRSH